MPTIEETATGQTPLASALSAGLDNISYSATITLRRYVRHVLPLDGFVFWVLAPLQLSGSADLYNAHAMNVTPNNQGGVIRISDTELQVKGSLHFTTSAQQQEDNSAATNPAVLTTTFEVEVLNRIDPNVMWVAEFQASETDPIKRIGFSQSFQRYRQANLWHYRGQALNSWMESQLVNALSDLNTDSLVVSNSLPAWLALNQIVQLYPSYLVAPNIEPPYGVVHIDPNETQALQDTPWIDEEGSSWQLARDLVKITLYGVRNDQAVDFQRYVLDYMTNEGQDILGLMSMPILRDEKATQVDFQAIAQKKTIFFEVSYYQARMMEVARKLITAATVQITVLDSPS